MLKYCKNHGESINKILKSHMEYDIFFLIKWNMILNVNI